MGERFNGTHVLVTGGSSGIGRSLASAFHAEGAKVTISGRDQGRLDEAAAAIDAGDSLIGVPCDVADASAVETMVARAQEAFGPVDVLVNNAGTVTLAECAEMTEDEWDVVMDTNVKGAFLCSRSLLPDLRQRRGNIVNVSSQAGKLGYRRLTHYCASKAALLGFSRALAIEVAPEVRVNAICPGIVETEMMEREYDWEEDLTGEPRADIKRRFLGAIPLGRFQQGEDIARVALFLASPDAREITGAAINVTGGSMVD